MKNEKNDLLFDIVTDKTKEQEESYRFISSKANIVFVVIGIIFAIYIQLLATDKLHFSSYRYFVITETVLFLISACYTFKSFIPHKNDFWFIDPAPPIVVEFFNKHSDKDIQWLKSKVINNMTKAFKKNEKLITRNYKFLEQAKWFLLSGIIIFLIHFTLAVFNIERLFINLKG